MAQDIASEVPEEMWEVVLHRLESMPSHLRLSIGGEKSLSKAELIEHVRRRDRIGKLMALSQYNYLKSLKTMDQYIGEPFE